MLRPLASRGEKRMRRRSGSTIAVGVQPWLAIQGRWPSVRNTSSPVDLVASPTPADGVGRDPDVARLRVLRDHSTHAHTGFRRDDRLIRMVALTPKKLLSPIVHAPEITTWEVTKT